MFRKAGDGGKRKLGQDAQADQAPHKVQSGGDHLGPPQVPPKNSRRRQPTDAVDTVYREGEKTVLQGQEAGRQNAGHNCKVEAVISHSVIQN